MNPDNREDEPRHARRAPDLPARVRTQLGRLEYTLLALIAVGVGITIALALINPAP